MRTEIRAGTRTASSTETATQTATQTTTTTAPSPGFGSIAQGSLHVVLHDVAPPTLAACRRVLAALDAAAASVCRPETPGTPCTPAGARRPLPVTLLTVPRYHGAPRDSGFERWLLRRAAAGDEVALHGYTHRDDGPPPRTLHDWLLRRVYTRGEGEFWRIDSVEARRRIDAGLRWLHGLGLVPQGFVAPAWLLGAGARQALAGFGFAYTCTLGHVQLLRDGGVERSVASRAQVFSTSTAWRRALAVPYNAALARAQRRQPVVRLELHPHDADHDAVRRCWQGLLQRQLRERRAGTLADLAAAAPGKASDRA